MDYIESLRRKIGHDEIIAVGAGVFPVRDGKVLLQRRRDNGCWSMHGGSLKIGETPEEAEGYGLLDTGTGSMEKVHVTAGVLDNAVNEALPDGGTNMTAYVLIGGQKYEVKGVALTSC